MADMPDFASQILAQAGERIQKRLSGDIASKQAIQDRQSKVLMDSITSGYLSPEEEESTWLELKRLGGSGGKDVVERAQEAITKLKGFLAPPPRDQRGVNQRTAAPPQATPAPTQPSPESAAASASLGPLTPPPAMVSQPSPALTTGARLAKSFPNPQSIKIADEQRGTQAQIAMEGRNQQGQIEDEARAQANADRVYGRARTDAATDHTRTRTEADTDHARAQGEATAKATNDAMEKEYQANLLHQHQMELEALRTAGDVQVAKSKPVSVFGAAPRNGPEITVETMQHARTVNPDSEFLDAHGDPIDPSLYKPDTVFRTILTPPSEAHPLGVYYTPASVKETRTTVGNTVIASSPYNVSGIASGGGTRLGPARVGSTTGRETLAIDGDGNVVPQTLYSQTTPGTSGARVGLAQGGSPQAVQNKFADTDQIIIRAHDGRELNLTPQMWSAAQVRATPMREAANQILGDPLQPSYRGFKDYGQVADNKASQERLGKAFRITLTDIGQAEKSHGSIVNLLKYYVGAPQALVDAEATAIRDTLSALTTEERATYDATMSAYATVVGIRSLTKASAAEFSVTTLERELPLIGINTTDSKTFYNKLARLAKEIQGGTVSLPNQIMSSAQKDWYKSQVDELQRLGAGTAVPPPPGAGPSRVRVRNKQTGQTGTVPLEEFNANPSLYEKQ